MPSSEVESQYQHWGRGEGRNTPGNEKKWNDPHDGQDGEEVDVIL